MREGMRPVPAEVSQPSHEMSGKDAAEHKAKFDRQVEADRVRRQLEQLQAQMGAIEAKLKLLESGATDAEVEKAILEDDSIEAVDVDVSDLEPDDEPKIEVGPEVELTAREQAAVNRDASLEAKKAERAAEKARDWEPPSLAELVKAHTPKPGKSREDEYREFKDLMDEMATPSLAELKRMTLEGLEKKAQKEQAEEAATPTLEELTKMSLGGPEQRKLQDELGLTADEAAWLMEGENMTGEQVQEKLDEMAGKDRRFEVAQELAGLEQEIKGMEQEVSALESKLKDKYGVDPEVVATSATKRWGLAVRTLTNRALRKDWNDYNEKLSSLQAKQEQSGLDQLMLEDPKKYTEVMSKRAMNAMRRRVSNATSNRRPQTFGSLRG